MSSTFDSREVSEEDLGDLNFEILSNVTPAVEAATTTLRGGYPSIKTTTSTHGPGVSVLTTFLNTSAVALMKNTTTSEPSRSQKYHYYGPEIVGIFCFFLVVFFLLSVLGNTFVILTILRNRGMRTRTNLLLANLAIADILVAVLDMPVAGITLLYGDWKFSRGFCYLNGFTVGLGLMVSVHTLMWISIHKYISITRPFSRSVTPRRIGYMIAACWFWAVIYNLTPIMGFTEMVYKKGASQCGPKVPETLQQKIHSYVNTFFNLVLPISVMSYCYYNIFAEVKRHLVRMRDSSNLDFRNTVLQQQRISLTLFIVLACFIVCWIPYIFYSMFLVVGGKSKVNIIFNPIAYLFGYMNSACNPIIYAFRSPSFRCGYKDILCGRKRGVPGARTYKNWNTCNRHRHPDILGTFRERKTGNRVVIGSEREETPRTNNLKYKKVVLDREGIPQGLGMTSSAPKYDMGIAMTKNTVEQEEFFRRSSKQRAVEQEAYSEGCVYTYTTHQKTRLDSPFRTRHKSEQTGKQRRIPEIQLSLTGHEKQRPVFLCNPVNHAEDMDEVNPVSPTTPREPLIQNFARDVLEENICLFAEPLEELEREGVDMNILGKRLVSNTRKKNPDEIRSWCSEELLDSEKGRSQETFDMTSISASNPNLVRYLGDDNKPEQKGSIAFLGVQGLKVRCNSHQEELFVHSDSNLVGPKKTSSANDIDTGQNLEGNVRPMPFRGRGYTVGGTRWNNGKASQHRLMWQASVEGLGGHVRQVDIGHFSKEEKGRVPEKANEGNFLGLTSLLTTVRRSLSDFFSVEPTSNNEDKKNEFQRNTGLVRYSHMKSPLPHTVVLPNHRKPTVNERSGL